jgi:hypothetical protein
VYLRPPVDEGKAPEGLTKGLEGVVKEFFGEMLTFSP